MLYAGVDLVVSLSNNLLTGSLPPQMVLVPLSVLRVQNNRLQARSRCHAQPCCSPLAHVALLCRELRVERWPTSMVSCCSDSMTACACSLSSCRALTGWRGPAAREINVAYNVSVQFAHPGSVPLPSSWH